MVRKVENLCTDPASLREGGSVYRLRKVIYEWQIQGNCPYLILGPN